MVQQHNREGQQFGNYRLERLLGRGGFAEVYLGYHLRLQRQAAIKVLHTHLSEQEIAAFQREAQIIAALNHPNIVRIFDFDVQHGIPFLVMDYLPHGTLRQRHSKGERVPLSLVTSYVKQIADALQYAHDQRLIHRDVKPENMLIGLRNEVVLSDFGIAAIAHSTTSRTAQESLGTIPYMAPEQIQAQACTASDQYALGIVVYEWLSGERPFDGSYTEIFAKHLMTSPPPLRKIVPTLSAEVEQAILTALAKDPRNRFSNIQAFAIALQDASQIARRQTGESVEEIVSPEASWSHPLPSSLPPTVVARPAPQVSTNFTPPFTQSFQVTTPSRSLQTPHQKVALVRKFSRRTVVISLTAAGIVAVGGGVAWWLLSPHPLYVYRGHSGNVESVVWSPLGGARIASASDDATVQVWNATDGGDLLTYHGHSNPVLSVAWSPNGIRIASASVDATVQVWNATDGGDVFTYRGHSNALNGVVNAVAWSPSGTRIASASYDRTVQVWDATDGSNVFTYHGHSNIVNAVAWSPDGRRIVSASRDGVVQVWDATDGGNVFTYHGHSRNVVSVAWSSSGTRIASASVDTTVQVWDAADGGNMFTYHGHSDVVNAVAWSPNGRRIASASRDHTVQVWDAADGGNMFTSYTYRGHSGEVNAVAWSSDGTRIVSAGRDATVQVWDSK